MIGSQVAALLTKGYARAASHVGMPHQQYRPASAINPLTTVLATVNASFNIGGSYKSQAKADQTLWQCITDAGTLQVGDFLVGSFTWSVIGMQALMPVLALRCNDSITVSRGTPLFDPTDGLHDTLTVIAQALPVYVQLKRDKGFSEPVGFPAPSNSSAAMPMLDLTLGLGGVVPAGFIEAGDMVTLSSGQKFKVDAVTTSTVTMALACTPYEPTA